VKRIDAEALSDAQIENLLDAAISPEASSDPNEEELRISLAGAQEKNALVWHDPVRGKPRAFRPGKDSADAVGVLSTVNVASAAVRCTGG
jgi:serine/threonine-protein kinase HipA